MKKLRILVGLFAVLWFSATAVHARPDDPPNDPTNIVGYRYKANWWELGASIYSIDLSKFSKEWLPDDSAAMADITVYSAHRTLRYKKSDVGVNVSLIFTGEYLGGILLWIPEDQKDFEFFNKYYTSSLRNAHLIGQEATYRVWEDIQGDRVYLDGNVGLDCPSLRPNTAILYLRTEHFPIGRYDGFPDWLIDMMNGFSYVNPEEVPSAPAIQT